MAELLVRWGADCTPPALEGIEAFIEACLAMDRAAVRELIARHPEYVRDHRPLFAALDGDRADVVEMLLDLGVSPDVEEPGGPRARALHAAAAKGATRSAALLLERGAEVDARDPAYGSTPLGWALYFDRREAVALLARHSRDVWRLTWGGQVARLAEVLGEEPELARVTNGEGETPLMWLPMDGGAAEEATRLLLEHGADPTRRNARGRTAADIAWRRGLVDVVELLRARGG